MFTTERRLLLEPPVDPEEKVSSWVSVCQSNERGTNEAEDNKAETRQNSGSKNLLLDRLKRLQMCPSDASSLLLAAKLLRPKINVR